MATKEELTAKQKREEDKRKSEQELIDKNGPWPIPVTAGIIDKTTIKAMEPPAWAALHAAVEAAAAAGVRRININAAAGPDGHASQISSGAPKRLRAKRGDPDVTGQACR